MVNSFSDRRGEQGRVDVDTMGDGQVKGEEHAGSRQSKGMRTASPRVGFCANRFIGLRCLRHLMAMGIQPMALFVPSPPTAEYADEMKTAVGRTPTFEGNVFGRPETKEILRGLNLDYLLLIHYPLLVPKDILAIPAIGTINVHPAFLPFNRGWHTPTWAILEGTSSGATAHWVDERVDTGDIALQQVVECFPSDTADSLYKRILADEFGLFVTLIERIKAGSVPRIPQSGPGSSHKKSDLFTSGIQELDLNQEMTVGSLLTRLRALSTNVWNES